MKKLLTIITAGVMTMGASAQITQIGGVDCIEHTYGYKISHDGKWVIGISVDGGTVKYNRETGDAVFYGEGDFGRGYVVADNGVVVGCVLVEYTEEYARTLPVFMYGDNQYIIPPSFADVTSGNIHSITPSQSRICGVIGLASSNYDNLPFYCDIDPDGTVGEVNLLPFPEKDFFGERPQYCSATWLSEDGKTILGQVIDARGFFIYPILYTQDAAGDWSYSFPSESLFNLENLPIPEPVKDISYYFPDAPYPEVQDFMTPSEYSKFMAAGSPYSELTDYMTEEEYNDFMDATDKYIIAQEEYELDYFQPYMEKYWAIVDTSVGFVRNAQALSADGKWIASSSQFDDMTNPDFPVGYYLPYVCNLETGEWKRFGPSRMSLVTNQVLPNGVVVCATPAGDIPACSYLYFSETDEFISLLDYINRINPEYGAWYLENLTDEVLVAEESDGNLIFDEMTVTGLAAFSEDMSVVSAGTDGYVLGKNMYFTYMLDGLNTAGVKTIVDENQPIDGVYTVYNLQGMKVLQTKNMEAVKSLAHGVYIVNGKKVVL